MAAIICPCPKDAFATPIPSTRCCPSGSFSRSLKFVSTTRESFGSPSSARAYMGQAHQYLLPALNVLTYHDPFAWHEAKAGASYSAMYELASHDRLFIELLDETIEETWGTRKDELPYHQETENRRSRFAEDACATIYAANYTDPRIRELNSIDLNISPRGKELFQRLTPPSATR